MFVEELSARHLINETITGCVSLYLEPIFCSSYDYSLRGFFKVHGTKIVDSQFFLKLLVKIRKTLSISRNFLWNPFSCRHKSSLTIFCVSYLSSCHCLPLVEVLLLMYLSLNTVFPLIVFHIEHFSLSSFFVMSVSESRLVAYYFSDKHFEVLYERFCIVNFCNFFFFAPLFL